MRRYGSLVNINPSGHIYLLKLLFFYLSCSARQQKECCLYGWEMISRVAGINNLRYFFNVINHLEKQKGLTIIHMRAKALSLTKSSMDQFIIDSSHVEIRNQIRNSWMKEDIRSSIKSFFFLCSQLSRKFSQEWKFCRHFVCLAFPKIDSIPDRGRGRFWKKNENPPWSRRGKESKFCQKETFTFLARKMSLEFKKKKQFYWNISR